MAQVELGGLELLEMEDGVLQSVLSSFDSSSATRALETLQRAGWLSPRLTSAVFADLVMQYPPDIAVSARVALEVDSAGLHSMRVLAYSSRTALSSAWTYTITIAVVSVLMITAFAQLCYEVVEWRKVGRASYLRDFWNAIEMVIIALAFCLAGLLASSLAVAGPLLLHGDLATACLPLRPAVALACPHLTGAALVSPCRTQLLWSISEKGHAASIFLGSTLLLSGFHWIK